MANWTSQFISNGTDIANPPIIGADGSGLGPNFYPYGYAVIDLVSNCCRYSCAFLWMFPITNTTIFKLCKISICKSKSSICLSSWSSRFCYVQAPLDKITLFHVAIEWIVPSNHKSNANYEWFNEFWFKNI